MAAMSEQTAMQRVRELRDLYSRQVANLKEAQKTRDPHSRFLDGTINGLEQAMEEMDEWLAKAVPND